jgi:hypothetical protein
MTKEEFCEECGGECCNIYDLFITGDNIELKRESFFKDRDQFGVEPLERVEGKCEYLGEKGCIIKKENRPTQCLSYECDKLKKFY